MYTITCASENYTVKEAILLTFPTKHVIIMKCRKGK